MRLLIITQKVDKEDSTLGFFHNWLLKLSTKFESLTVICLEKGESDLPKNVKVLSLGKENGENRLTYIFNFYKYIWQERKNYDAVLVHMNQEYILLGWKIWKILGKKIYFWRNHPYGNIFTRLAVLLSDKVFCTSKNSFTARFKKTELMPVGIDTDLFKPISNLKYTLSKENKVLFLGRISLVKNIHLLTEAATILKRKGSQFTLDIIGDPVNHGDLEYRRKLINPSFNFQPGVPNYKTPEIYNHHEIFVNLTPLGSFDKTILEAAACGCLTLSVNPVFSSIDPRLVCEMNKEDVSSKLSKLLDLNEDEKRSISEKLQSFVSQNHSLEALIQKLDQSFI